MPYILIPPLSLALGLATAAAIFGESGPLLAFGVVFAFIWVAPLTLGQHLIERGGKVVW